MFNLRQFCPINYAWIQSKRLSFEPSNCQVLNSLQLAAIFFVYNSLLNGASYINNSHTLAHIGLYIDFCKFYTIPADYKCGMYHGAIYIDKKGEGKRHTWNTVSVNVCIILPPHKFKHLASIWTADCIELTRNLREKPIKENNFDSVYFFKWFANIYA